jgi:hypothetical protein
MAQSPIVRVSTLLVLLLAGCGGATANQRGGGGGSSTSSTEMEAPVWASLKTDVDLRDYVRAAATDRLREDQPDVDPASFGRWIATPEAAPGLSGRAVERLLTLAAVAFADGDLDRSEGLVRLVRARALNRNMAHAGTTLLAVAASKRAGADDAARLAAVQQVFAQLPPERVGSAAVTFQLYQSGDQLKARALKAREQLLSLDSSSTALYFEQVLPEAVAHRETLLAAVDAAQKAHAKGKKPKKYAFGTVAGAALGKTAPIRAAVWDLGTNPELFKKQLFSNAAEVVNGKDDDNNGLVDDRHGIAHDPDPKQTALVYAPAPEVLAANKPFLKGVMDLRAGLSTTEDAKKVLALFGAATTSDAVESLETNLDAVGEWAHGTHVAGILMEGVPKAELVIFRSAWAGESRVYHHRGPSDAELEQERANMRAIAAFIKAHNVRVVNASLGFAVDYLEDELSHETAKYKDEAAVRARAKAVQGIRRANWREVFEACPDTLFVVAAGNSNRDVLEYGDTPADIALPNVLTIGAVDEFGKWATFTNSNATQVRAFDFGVAVPSLVPSGERVPLSGTSMASPNAANAAIKVLSVNPALRPADVIAVLTEHADDIAPPFAGKIINEKKAVAAAKKSARKAAPGGAPIAGPAPK